MAEEEFNFKVVDSSGNEVINSTLMTYKNGFVDLWLPRNETFTVTIQHQDLSYEGELTTFEGDATCVTTMQLK